LIGALTLKGYSHRYLPRIAVFQSYIVGGIMQVKLLYAVCSI
jgi:hypothetical protein